MLKGTKKLISYAFRAFSNSEKKYSQIQKESLSVIFQLYSSHSGIMTTYFQWQECDKERCIAFEQFRKVGNDFQRQ